MSRSYEARRSDPGSRKLGARTAVRGRRRDTRLVRSHVDRGQKARDERHKAAEHTREQRRG